MRHLTLFTCLAFVLLAGCEQASIPTAVENADPTEAELAVAAKSGSDIIPGRFIVTLREGVSPSTVANEYNVQPEYVYLHALNGFAGAISEAAKDGLLRDSRVVLVEPDGLVRVVAEQKMDANGDPWGLDRIDARSGLDKSFVYMNQGSGVRAYIIDTGIKISHGSFGGRASHGYDAVDKDATADDCNGHGTHVAGTVGGATWGVAKGVSLVAVRVLDCGGSGTISGVIAGVDWVTAHHVKPAVANMSLGGSGNTSLDNAVKNSIAAGISYAVAAGNGNIVGIAQDACKYSPARVAEAMTIGATDKADKKASWSNYGKCLDWFAPGVGIKSAWYTNDTATKTISGTSMAAPHAAGVAALYLQSYGTANPQQVRDAIYKLTTKKIVSSSRTTNNHLLFTNL